MTQDPPLAEIGAGAAADAGGVDHGAARRLPAGARRGGGSGTRLDRAALGRCRDAGRRAADRGVPPRALVDLYLSAAWRLWRHLPEVMAAEDDPAGVVRAGELMLRSVDDAVAVLIEGYQLARRDLVRSQVAARREFVDDLLIGGAQALPDLVQRAGLFGLSLVGPQAVIVVRAERDFTDSSPLTALLERSIQGGSADADALVTTKDGLLVVIFAAPDRAAIDQVIAGLTGSLPSDPREPVNLRRTAAVGAWRMGVGRAHPGPGGVRLSYEQAREALDLGARLGGTARVLDAADLLMHRVLVRDRVAMSSWWRPCSRPCCTPAVASSRCCRPWRPTSPRAATPPWRAGRCTCRCGR